ncbi:dipeptide/oligopeptide/nickel ABC transporter ATP-binding protein [Brevibacillus reuszeri]|uniref:Dipeptide/oligopeptide/nickel ABC transporter ATP-binding protein n=1 Tax=Brevibacillus reuszeri TaxID=54915 RepID=A0A0K9YLQ9_9BACL|nr:ABC transporter ATP-binding protein [Brevibacillus reuszeri]KNB69592.1 peptide ABC transporter ATP-binding protein [Brevibacillus reuszeri]MED1856037.1 ABC transporter ATP-binding protein [Brevibacillus reuszeri]GED71298.1 dipeptide/oligopeptide/nickel ABC transporter ATP-binding protein [Brevibacillus reuszeri]
MSDKLLEVKQLRISFQTETGTANVVNGIDLTVYPKETLGIVGESGCGKSVTSLAIMGLIPTPPGKVQEGEIWFNGCNLLAQKKGALRKIRGNEISMIFQEPMSSLDPAFTIGSQITEAITFHEKASAAEVKSRSIELLRLVGIPNPEQRYKEYPHQISGGMRQRVMIAIALACTPKLLIADEPTTALDVTVQAQILELMNDIRERLHTAILLITHDLGVVAEMCDRVVVMYAGEIVEEATTELLFDRTAHPYTEGLLNSMPKLDGPKTRLTSIEGNVPSPTEMPTGCRFCPRCSYATEICWEASPQLVEIEVGHKVRCWYAKDILQQKGR